MILSVPLDSQSHGRPEKEQSLTHLAAVMGVLMLGRDGLGERTGKRKGELDGGVGTFILNNFIARDFHVKMQKKHLAAGLRTDPTGKT